MSKNIFSKEELARFAIRSYLDTGHPPEINAGAVEPVLRRRTACFVTVYVKNTLRGCIGTIEPVGPLYRSILHNAVAAASEDFRFPPITKKDLPDLKVEISVLSPVRPYLFKHNAELIAYLSQNKPGLVLEKFGRKALFLPQVWKEIPDPQEFLAHLSLKAGLSPVDWQEGTKFWVFEVIR